jgi:transcription antitermination factor NusG
MVIIKEGPFTGVYGRVARISGQQRVIVTLSQFGLISTAYIPTAFIERLNTNV